MILFTIIISGIALLGLIVATMMLRSSGHHRPATLADLEALFESGPNRYDHLERILGPSDFEFLASSRRGADLLERLRRNRIALMGAYLKQIRAEFDSLLAIGSLFAAAPTAQAENFARRLAQQHLRFRLLFFSLWAKLRLNRVVRWQLDIGQLTREINSLRYQADRILRALTPDDLGTLREVLRNS